MGNGSRRQMLLVQHQEVLAKDTLLNANGLGGGARVAHINFLSLGPDPHRKGAHCIAPSAQQSYKLLMPSQIPERPPSPRSPSISSYVCSFVDPQSERPLFVS